ncbi:uncharacterized protein J3R85_003151 [Psidium guajava]|nr:uncharacterized protein J3R85_003151 [Psidium guajava]
MLSLEDLPVRPRTASCRQLAAVGPQFRRRLDKVRTLRRPSSVHWRSGSVSAQPRARTRALALFFFPLTQDVVMKAYFFSGALTLLLSDLLFLLSIEPSTEPGRSPLPITSSGLSRSRSCRRSLNRRGLPQAGPLMLIAPDRQGRPPSDPCRTQLTARLNFQRSKSGTGFDSHERLRLIIEKQWRFFDNGGTESPSGKRLCHERRSPRGRPCHRRRYHEIAPSGCDDGDRPETVQLSYSLGFNSMFFFYAFSPRALSAAPLFFPSSSFFFFCFQEAPPPRGSVFS